MKALVLSAALVVSTASVAAEPEMPVCGPFVEFNKSLAEKYHEKRIGVAMVNPQAVLVFFSSPNGETYTILSVGVNGIACIVSTGTDIEFYPGEVT